LDPNILTISGGPNFSYDNEERKAFLMQRPCIDFYTLTDGEQAFTNLVRNWVNNGFDIEKLRSTPNEGIASISPDKREFVLGPLIDRFKNLDDVPSAYLNGMFDKFLKLNYMPALNTSRGCPYTCTFCHTGNPHKVRSHSVDRVKQELDYIVENVSDSHNKNLSFFDDNFGLYKEDIEIAKHVTELRRKTNWPHSVEGAGAVKKGGRTYLPDHVIMKDRNLSWSFQSMNLETLRVVRRSNPTVENILEVSKDILKRQKLIPCEMIAPMPLETTDSYFAGLKFLIEKGFSTQTYTTMMLPGTEMANPKSRSLYDLQTQFRLIPRQFGEYGSKKIFEIEEVCVATNTLSLDEYYDIRNFSLITRIFTNEQFSLLTRYLEEIGLSRFDFTYKVFELVNNGETALSSILEHFAEEAESELFSSKEELIEEYSSNDHYDELLKLNRADNLIRKYTAKAFFLPWNELLDTAVAALKELDQDYERHSEAIHTIYMFQLKTKDINSVILGRTDHLSGQCEAPYDVCAWAEDKDNKALQEYKNNTVYQVKITDQNRKALEAYSSYKDMRGGDDEFALGNLITRGYQLRDLWLSAERIN